MKNEHILQTKGNSAIQAHITMMQNIIDRMASNSSNCKSWCLSIVAAVFAFYFTNANELNNLDFLYVIVGLFAFLDCYYLGLEKCFKDQLREYVSALNGENTDYDVAKRTYIAGSSETYSNCCLVNKLMKIAKQIGNTIRGVFSFSTAPFYCILFVVIYQLA